MSVVLMRIPPGPVKYGSSIVVCFVTNSSPPCVFSKDYMLKSGLTFMSHVTSCTAASFCRDWERSRRDDVSRLDIRRGKLELHPAPLIKVVK